MLGEELGPKDYSHVPGVLLGLKDHLQVARTTAQSSLKLLLQPSSFVRLLVDVDVSVIPGEAVFLKKQECV